MDGENGSFPTGPSVNQCEQASSGIRGGQAIGSTRETIMSRVARIQRQAEEAQGRVYTSYRAQEIALRNPDVVELLEALITLGILRS